MSSSQSSASKGGTWTRCLYFTPDAKNLSEKEVKVTNDELKPYFKKQNASDEKIERVSIYKRNLKWYIPKWCGLWHEFTVVESKNWYWSFEKFADSLRIQRSREEKYVKEYERGVEREGSIEPEGRPSVNGDQEETIQDVVEWMHKRKFLDWSYHLTENNCHHFASLVYEFLGGIKVKEWRKKKKLYFW